MLKILLTTNSRGFALLPPSQTILNNQMKARAVWKKSVAEFILKITRNLYGEIEKIISTNHGLVFWKRNSLDPSNFPLTRGIETKLSWIILQSFNSWLIQLTIKPILPNCQVPNLFLCNCKFYHSRIEVSQNCSVLTLSGAGQVIFIPWVAAWWL